MLFWYPYYLVNIKIFIGVQRTATKIVPDLNKISTQLVFHESCVKFKCVFLGIQKTER